MLKSLATIHGRCMAGKRSFAWAGTRHCPYRMTAFVICHPERSEGSVADFWVVIETSDMTIHSYNYQRDYYTSPDIFTFSTEELCHVFATL
jgi:hypothetical protein